MTDTMKPPVRAHTTQLWNSMPGWGIVANLLPPEVLAARRVRVLRKLVVAALAVVVLLGAGGYGYAFWQARSAKSDLHAAQDQTTQLQLQQRKYGAVVQLQNQAAQIKSQLGGLLSADVNVPKLATAIMALSPAKSSLTKLDVEVTTASAQPASSNADSSGVLDTSGHQHIGTITVTGTVHSIDDVATYVTRLSGLPGIVEVFPASQQNDGKLVTYSIEMTMTDQLYSNRFAAATSAAATTGGN